MLQDDYIVIFAKFQKMRTGRRGRDVRWWWRRVRRSRARPRAPASQAGPFVATIGEGALPTEKGCWHLWHLCTPLQSLVAALRFRTIDHPVPHFQVSAPGVANLPVGQTSGPQKIFIFDYIIYLFKYSNIRIYILYIYLSIYIYLYIWIVGIVCAHSSQTNFFDSKHGGLGGKADGCQKKKENCWTTPRGGSSLRWAKRLLAEKEAVGWLPTICIKSPKLMKFDDELMIGGETSGLDPFLHPSPPAKWPLERPWPQGVGRRRSHAEGTFQNHDHGLKARGGMKHWASWGWGWWAIFFGFEVIVINVWVCVVKVSAKANVWWWERNI